MVDWIVTALVVSAIFAGNALLLTLFLWRTDPYQFATWMRALRARRERWKASRPHRAAWVRAIQWRLPQWRPPAKPFARLSTRAVRRAVPPAARMRPTASDERATARLEYWLTLENLERRRPT